MINFRYHLVSLVAVFLALSTGLALGSTVLQDPLLDRLGADAEDLHAEADQLRAANDLARQHQAGSDALLGRYAADVLAGHLTDATVVVIAAPGSDPRVAAGLAERVADAGGTVTGTIRLADAYIDPDRATFVGELSDQLDGGATDGGAHQRAAAVLARALLTQAATDTAEDGDADDDEDGADAAEDSEPADTAVAERTTGPGDAAATLDGFAAAELLTVAGEPENGADVALLLAPTEPYPTAPGADQPTGNAAVLELGQALATTGPGAVLAGDPRSASVPTGLLHQARGDADTLSTVNVAGTTAGDIATALALAAVLDGAHGHWGVGETARDGYLPVGATHQADG